jgi:hypothetical protein
MWTHICINNFRFCGETTSQALHRILIKLVIRVVKVVKDIKDIGAPQCSILQLHCTMAINEDVAVFVAYMIYYFMQEYLLQARADDRAPALFDDRLNWARIIAKHGTRSSFKRHLRMSLPSFNKLLSYIRPELEVDELQSAQ